MDMDEDDDFYGDSPKAQAQSPPKIETKEEQKDDSKPKSPRQEASTEEGGEEDEEEESDSDIEIVTERKDGTKAPPPPTTRYNDIRNIPQRSGSKELSKSPVAVKKDPGLKQSIPTKAAAAHPGGEVPPECTSTVDVDAKPIYKPARKPITEVNIDTDLPAEHERPWRRPGADISDYFNYGFDEFTWALYAQKQENLRNEFDQSKLAENQKKMMEDMAMMMGGMGGMPGMPAMPGMPGAPAGGMPGMDGMPPDMQAMMQQMMAGGMDPSQMDPSMFGGQAAGGAAGGQGGQQNAGFQGQQNFGQQGQQGFGYDQQNMGGGHRGNFRGRGRGRW